MCGYTYMWVHCQEEMYPKDSCSLASQVFRVWGCQWPGESPLALHCQALGWKRNVGDQISVKGSNCQRA